MKIKKLKSNIKTKVPIIDVETGNDLKKLGWDYVKSDIITGFAQKYSSAQKFIVLHKN